MSKKKKQLDIHSEKFSEKLVKAARKAVSTEIENHVKAGRLPKKEEKVEIEPISDDEVDDMVVELHRASIRWAKSLDDEDQKQAWLNFYKVCESQDRETGEYWREKRKAVKRSWVLEMNGLLPYQNNVMPPLEECRKIWDENYGR